MHSLPESVIRFEDNEGRGKEGGGGEEGEDEQQG